MLNNENVSILQILQSLNLVMEKEVKDRKSWLPHFVTENCTEDNAFQPIKTQANETTESVGESVINNVKPGNGQSSFCEGNKIFEMEINQKSIYPEKSLEQENAEKFNGPENCKLKNEKIAKDAKPPTDSFDPPCTSLKSYDAIVSEVELEMPNNNTIPPPPISQSPSKDSIIIDKLTTKTPISPPLPPPPPPMPTEGNNKMSPSRPKGPIKLEASHQPNEFFQEISSKFKPEKFTLPIIESSKQSPKKITASSNGVNVEQNRSAMIEHIAEVGIKKTIGISAQEMFKAITSFDFENLAYDAIEILLENVRKEQTTPPGTKKSKEIMSYRNVLETIEDGKQILKSMLYFKSFLSEFKRLEDHFSKMKQVFESLAKSAKQFKFCQLIRNIMEFASTGSAGDNGYLTNGFKLETLPTLWDTKPFNGKSGMNIFVDNLVKNNSETLTFYEDFEYLDGFSCPDPVTLNKDLKMLRNRLEKATTVVDNLSKGQTENNFDHILNMIPEMENKIKILENDWELTFKSYSDCLAAYGQTEKEPYKFLLVEILQNFIKEFRLEKQAHETQKKKIEKSAEIDRDSPKENKTGKCNTKKTPQTNERKLPGKTLATIPEASDLEKAIFLSPNNFGTGTRRRKRAETKTESQNRERISTNTYIR